MVDLVAHSDESGSLLNVAVADGCLVTVAIAVAGSGSRVGRCCGVLGGTSGGGGRGDGGAVVAAAVDRKGASTYSLVARSLSGLGTVRVTGGAGRKGASGTVRGGTFIIGARGR